MPGNHDRAPSPAVSVGAASGAVPWETLLYGEAGGPPTGGGRTGGAPHGGGETAGQPQDGGEPAPRRGAIARLAGKIGWNLIDQVLSTLSNAGLSILVAREVSKDAFGAFASAILLFSLLISFGRSLSGSVLGIRYSAVEGRDNWARVAARSTGTVLVLAVPAGALLMLSGLVLPGLVLPDLLRWPLIAVGFTMPALLLQDNMRSLYFAQSRPDLAALNDGLWALIQFPVTGILLVLGWATTGSMILVWGLAAGICAAVALVQVGALPDPRAFRGWVRSHRDLLAYMLPSTLINTGGIQVAYLAIGLIVNLGATGSVTAARQIFNPLLVLSQAVSSFATPEISRRMHLSVRQRWLVAVALSGVQAVASLVYLGIVLLIPNWLGTEFFGKTWPGAHSVLVPVGLFSTVAGICMGPFLVMSAMGHAKRTFRVSMLSTVLSVSGLPIGAVLAGASGAAWGLLAGQAIELPFWFLLLRAVVPLGPVAHVEEDDDPPDTSR